MPVNTIYLSWRHTSGSLIDSVTLNRCGASASPQNFVNGGWFMKCFCLLKELILMHSIKRANHKSSQSKVSRKNIGHEMLFERVYWKTTSTQTKRLLQKPVNTIKPDNVLYVKMCPSHPQHELMPSWTIFNKENHQTLPAAASTHSTLRLMLFLSVSVLFSCTNI